MLGPLRLPRPNDWREIANNTSTAITTPEASDRFSGLPWYTRSLLFHSLNTVTYVEDRQELGYRTRDHTGITYMMQLRMLGHPDNDRVLRISWDDNTPGSVILLYDGHLGGVENTRKVHEEFEVLSEITDRLIDSCHYGPDVHLVRTTVIMGMAINQWTGWRRARHSVGSVQRKQSREACRTKLRRPFRGFASTVSSRSFRTLGNWNTLILELTS